VEQLLALVVKNWSFEGCSEHVHGGPGPRVFRIEKGKIAMDFKGAQTYSQIYSGEMKMT
jgi:hypothetical protein